jgi:hypothetical protein
MIAVICTCVAYLFFVVGPVAETRFWPVLGKLEVTYVSAYDAKSSHVSVQFRKIRDCEYIGMSWFRIDPNGSLERVSMILLRNPHDTSSPNRPVGRFSAGPWHVFIPADELLEVSMVEVFHRCHPFWTTRTHFYP